MKRFALLLGLVLSLVGGASVAQASVDAPAPLPITVDLSDHPMVEAVVGMPAELTGESLPSSAFSVEEAGDRRRHQVRQIAGSDLEVLLVVDTSGSMSGAPLAGAKAAAHAFLDRLPAAALVGVVGFGPEAGVAAPFTPDRGALHAAVDGLQAGGETALFDALVTAAAQFDPATKAQRTVVVLSDGADTVSASSREVAEEALVSKQVTLHGVELLSSEHAPQNLVDLTAATGGQLASATDAATLTGIYDRLAAVLASQYVVRYRSAVDGPAELVIRVAHGGLTGEARTTLDLAGPPVTTIPPTTVPVSVPELEPAGAPVDEPSPLPLLLGALLLFAGLVILGIVVTQPARRRRRVRLSATEGAEAGKTAVTELAARASLVADRVLEANGRRNDLNSLLERAGVALRPGEFLVFVLCIGLVAFAIGVLLSGFVVGMILAVVAGVAVRAGLRFKADRRRAKFKEQLADTLQLISGSLRAGYALMQAVDAVSHEAPAPTCDEFRRLVLETRLGRDLAESLDAMAARLDSEDFEWVVQAIAIHREVGGDLAGVLDNLAETIRERAKLERHVKALTAEGRLSAYVLIALPFFLLGFMSISNPSYAAELFRGAGLVLSAVGLVLMIGGAIWFKKLCKLIY